MGKPDGSGIIKNAWAIVNATRERHQSESTVRQYHNHWRRMQEDPLAALDAADSLASFHARQCAAKFIIASALGGLLEHYGEAKGDDVARKHLMRDIVDVFVLYGEIESRRFLKEGRPRKSKRNLLSKLPPDWVDQLLAQADEDEMKGRVCYRRELLFLAVTGCRVAELFTGTHAMVDDGLLRIHIVGKKVTDRSGQPWRTLYVAPSSSAAAGLLFEEARKWGPLSPHASLNERTIREYVRRLSQRRFGRNDLTPIVFRERLFALLKSEGAGRGVVAAALGHISDRSQARYGLYGQAKGSSGLIRVETARQVIIHTSGHEKFLASDDEGEDLD